MKTRFWAFLLVLAALGTAAGLAACSNSILRNVTEAGVETALEGPLPTPTLTRQGR